MTNSCCNTGHILVPETLYSFDRVLLHDVAIRECSRPRAYPLMLIVAHVRIEKYSVIPFEVHSPYRLLDVAEKGHPASIQNFVLDTAFVVGAFKMVLLEEKTAQTDHAARVTLGLERGSSASRINADVFFG